MAHAGVPALSEPALVAAHEERLDERVADGDLTGEEAADHLAEVEERIAEVAEHAPATDPPAGASAPRPHRG